MYPRVCWCVGVSLAVCGSVSLAAPVMGEMFVGVLVFASSACSFRGAARLAAFVLVTLAHMCRPNTCISAVHRG